MRTKKVLALVLAALTLLGVAGSALAAPKPVVLGSGINVGGTTITGGSSSGSSSSTQTQTTRTGTIVNCSSWVSMRKSASSSSSRIAKLSKGVSVTILDASGSYYKISYDGKEGYVSSQYVQLSSGSNANTNNNTAATGTGVTTGNINFRTGPSTSYSKVSGCSKVPKNASVEILGESNGWYQVRYNGYTGYLSGEYVKLSSSGLDVTNPDGSSNTSTNNNAAAIGTGTTTGSVNFRTGPSTSYSKVSGCSKVPKNVSVEILGESNGWYQVRYNGYTGYLSADYVKVSSGSNSNNNSNNNSLNPVTPGNNGADTIGARRYAKYTGTTSDRWGTIQVAGTNINAYIYCNALDSKGNFRYNKYDSKTNYIYAMSYHDDPIAVITGHNMRVSQTGLHALHHVQNAWLGKSKCDYTKRCSASCADCKTSTFNIHYNGASKWQLVCFYEIDKSTVSSSSTRKKIMNLNCFNSTVTGDLKQQWLDSQFRYATSAYRGMKVANATSSDKLMLLMTCADSSGDSYQRLYMVLKAVG